MALKNEVLKVEAVEAVARLVRERLGAERAGPAEHFVLRFFANVAPEDMIGSNPEQLYGMALALWQFAAVRTPGQALVRVYNPRVADHGWQSPHTVVEIVTDDMPFLVDSVTSTLNRCGVSVQLVVHPVLQLQRTTDSGRVLDVEQKADNGDQETGIRDQRSAGGTHAPPLPASRPPIPEAFMHFAVDAQSDPVRLDTMATEIARVLKDVRAAVSDWQAMRDEAARIARTIPELPVAITDVQRNEAVDFLHWLDEDHFVFLGYREYRFDANPDGGEPLLDVVENSGLGLLRNPDVVMFEGLRRFVSLPPDMQLFLRQPHLVMVTKANHRSTVHRTAHMDSLFFKVFDADGRVVGERLFVGLFTSAAYAQRPQDIPFLRRKVARLLDYAGFGRSSHDGKALLHILETFPRDELVQASEAELFEIALGILRLQERQRLALFVRRDPFERFVSCLLFVPRDRYDTNLRQRLQIILEDAFNGYETSFATQINESVLARVHFIIQSRPGPIPEVDLPMLEARLIDAARAWPDRLREVLLETHGEEVGLRCLARYAQAFPSAYRERFSAEAAVADIEQIEDVLAQAGPVNSSAADGPVPDYLGMNLYRPLEARSHELRFKIYHARHPVPLSDVLPMLEHMDVRVVTEVPFAIRLPGADDPTVWIHDFELHVRGDAEVPDVGTIKSRFQEAFTRIWSGAMEDDGFNRMVLRCGIRAREIVILRAYSKYLRQIRFPYSGWTIENALVAHAPIVRLLLELFRRRLDPEDTASGRTTTAQLTEDALSVALDGVQNLDEDLILRRFATLIRATLRTNAFQKDAHGHDKPYLAFKFDSHALDGLPLPRPWVEVYVCSPRMEGIHLRGGPVARGGIRWSDRREDFRTEILGLMKAQMVKNAVIVPVGSKGGFVVKRPPPATAGREALLAEGIRCYQTLMRGLLDITDNLDSEGRVLPPPQVRRRDGDDPYLVVAADKGTASFSDIANAVSQDYGFWLGDAFASGGSKGYDHKKMGITARGAWESVKRHFRECGRDIQSQDFTVIGIGDMSGDVFGNGMLLSRHIRLLAAFDHRHIFIDPDPDPATSWAERQRLFLLPRSSWADYDRSRISTGGGVFARDAKTITPTPDMRARFAITAETVTPAELAQILLRAEVDLLWFGGIGTFVKASGESHADVGDKANDALRVDADTLRARVIGEGANLGMTQRARIEYARHGGRLNTDAIDNSAGVDTSDHEVNIKILLNEAVARQDLTPKQRDTLLAEMTDEVAALVLCDNYRQTQALTVLYAEAAERLERDVRFMRALEKAGRLDRRVELLPDDDEIAERQAAHQGLTRPELALLLAYGKIALYDDLLASDLPDDPRMVEDLSRYFPSPLQENFTGPIHRHRLRREIVATHAANSLVNRLGPTFVREMIERTGLSAADVTRAYLIVREVFGLRALWQAIEALDARIPAAVQCDMLHTIMRLMERTVAWFLAHGRHPLDQGEEVAAYRPGVDILAERLGSILGAEAAARLDSRTQTLTGHGVPEPLARRIAALPDLGAGLDIARIALRSAGDTPAVAGLYFALGQRLSLDWLRVQVLSLKAEAPWDKQAAAALIDDLDVLQGRLTGHALDRSGETGLETWLQQGGRAVERVQTLMCELRGQGQVDMSMLTVATRALRALAGE